MVVIGTGLITGLNGLTEGINVFLTDQFSTLGANVLMVFPSTQSFRLTPQVASRIKSISGVSAAIPYISQAVTMRSGGQSRRLTVAGMDQTKLPLIYPTAKLEAGYLPPPSDAISMLVGNYVAHPPDKTSPFVEVGWSVSLQYSEIETVGQTQRTVLKSRSFRVGGVLEYIGSMGFIPVDRMAFMSLAAADGFFGRGGVYDGIFVVTQSQDRNSAVQSAISKIYGRNLTVFSPAAIAQTIQKVISGIAVFVGGIAAISLLVASIGIITTLYTSVIERTREIGVLKALGFSDRLTLLLFLNEATLIGLLGASAGTFAGMGLAYLLNFALGGFGAGGQAGAGGGAGLFGGGGGLISGVKPVFQVQSMAQIWVFSVALSVVAGLYPAWRASRLDPVVALRKE
jgi:putative ABC transport system permease protein